MKNITISSLMMLAVLVIFGTTQAYGLGAANGKVAGQYIVVFKDAVNDVDGASDELAKNHGLSNLQTYRHALKGFAATVPAGRLKKLESDPRVEFVSEDRIVSIDRTVSIAAQTLPTGVNRIDAEQTPTHTNKGAGINVAIIDTGIDLKHPDLKTNIVGGKNCSSGKSYSDGNGHGTHVAGTVAAIDNGLGAVGVAPEAKLWAVRVLNNAGSGTWSSVICGIDFVTSKAPANGGPIMVANMSLGGGGTSDNNCGNTNNDALHKAICRSRDAGVTYVVAAGNNGSGAAAFVPAAYDDAVITVSALADSDGQ
ncbi:MAG: S8 family serine peptidase, partial [Patescibacteria group bacterium]